MRAYTVSKETPSITFGKTYVRIPYDIREEEPHSNSDGTQQELPEGYVEYSFEVRKLTYPQYNQLLITKEEAEIMNAETLITAFEMFGGGV